MKLSSSRGFGLALLLLALLSATQPLGSHAADAVYCVNCGSEVTQLANKIQLIQQVQTAVQSLQTQISQYQNLVTNTRSMSSQIWGNTMNDINSLYSLMKQSQALAHSASNLDDEFSRRYGSYDNYASKKLNGADWNSKYSQWSREANDNTLYTMKALGLQANQLQDEDALMQQLQNLSRSAEGRMQAMQVGNMMAAQGVRQTQKLRQLVMLQVQMQADYMAAQQDKEAAQQAAATRFHREINIPTNDGRRY